MKHYKDGGIKPQVDKMTDIKCILSMKNAQHKGINLIIHTTMDVQTIKNYLRIISRQAKSLMNHGEGLTYY